MQLETDLAIRSAEKSSCGQCSCVIIYKGNHCVFCTPAFELLKNALAEYGLDESIVSEVSIEDGCECGCDVDIAGIPAIRICRELIHGVPQEDHLRDSLMQAMMKSCFQDSRNE
ncbi:MAG: hypothetical protein HXY34_02440 [Candidatus Thorarchaeota archaeon]|nr:hypothetical protein [Candidatus Thorarchaeota archaeon]